MNDVERLKCLAEFGRFQELLSEYHKDDKLLKYQEFQTQSIYEVGLLLSKLGVNYNVTST